MNGFTQTNANAEPLKSIEATTKQAAALERAWSNRDFEIERYWGRATYFWAFTAASFAGYFAVRNASVKTDFEALPFIVACIGFLFGRSWYLVNRGSKYWQENWEKHIDMLEDAVTGPLYKTVLAGRSWSVSRVNIAVSFFVTIVWIFIAFMEAFPQWAFHKPDTSFSLPKLAMAAITLCFAAYLWFCAKSDINEPQKAGYYFGRRNTNYQFK